MPSGVYKHSEESKRKMREAHRKKRFGFQKGNRTKSQFKKGNKPIVPFKKGEIGYWKGKKKPPLSKEHKEKLREMFKGENNPNWKGGKSIEQYATDWTDDLRESIRKRDDYICQICGIHQDELIGRFKRLDVHHIDYNKYNLNPNNLISLCRGCHSKTNYNRKYWIQYFNKNICH